MREQRREAASKAHDITLEHMTVGGWDAYSRDEAREHLGKSWTNLCTIIVHNSETVSGMLDAIAALEEAGYVVSLNERDGQAVLEVKTTLEVMEGLGAHQQEMAQKTAEADEAELGE